MYPDATQYGTRGNFHESYSCDDKTQQYQGETEQGVKDGLHGSPRVRIEAKAFYKDITRSFWSIASGGRDGRMITMSLRKRIATPGTSAFL
ncbi:hypothetical protein [Gluconobacter cerinus]|uniref:hypothetical protein n=1 Tax=Gluconobacter cerinus TaxID=38307 RepID=UPI001B8AC347|nr:hypothetical protein [Gluconobacter cerinus]MBS1024669.1 hypothetical protein [Gluconobacter cerinus]MBS1042534.1 hypothetical protein [Gluconobacter cerinus]MBS1042607.1 hypothetical protein [Gluconobacter cerinus]